MTIIWTPRARSSLEAILLHIAQDDPLAAHTLVDQLIDAVEQTLSDQPMAGRPGRVAGTREWVAHKSYIVTYRVDVIHGVQILEVVHHARLWPSRF